MQEHNPYQTPEAAVADTAVESSGEPAERMTRLVAVLIDGLIAMLYVLAVMWALGIFDYFLRQPPVAPPSSLLYLSGAISFVLFVLINGYWLKKFGQTIGKRVMGVRIVDLNGNVPSLVRVVGLRYVVLRLLANIPIVGPFVGIVDALFIFRDDRRCLHDLIAGTRVVKV